MNKTAIATFILGAAAGAAASWFFAKKKYEQIAREEIESVKEVYSQLSYIDEDEVEEFTDEDCWNQNEEPEEEDEEPRYIPTMPDLQEYAKTLETENYNDEAEEPEEVETMDEPFVISPEEFGENDEYDQEILIHYADGVLTDNWGNIVEDIDDLVGHDYAEHFGEYEDDPDTVYIQNDTYNTYYEIQADTRNYADL